MKWRNKNGNGYRSDLKGRHNKISGKAAVKAAVIDSQWNGCYDNHWNGIIVDEAFAHPAKFAHGLIRRIYKHAVDEGWLKAGDTVVDPFGGVALGALYANKAGINYIGVELEQKFVDLGSGCDCQGISKSNWVRFYGRWDRASKAGIRWCPECLSQVWIERAEIKEDKQQSFFQKKLSASLIRHSGKIPFTQPHRYRGNLELFRKYAQPDTRAVLLQGDSRELVKVLGQAGVGMVVSSPPYATNDKRDYTCEQRDKSEQGKGSFRGFYGHAKGQIAKLSEGDPHVVIGSPPYVKSVHSGNGIDIDKLSGNSPGPNSQALAGGYGETTGQVGKMKEGDLKAVISSPPFTGSVGSDDPDKRGGLFRDEKRRNDMNLTGTYGETEGQLGGMPTGIISSPPYGNSMDNQDKGGIDWEKAGRPDRLEESKNRHGVQGDMPMAYGDGGGQLGNDSKETFWLAAQTIVQQCYQILPSGGHAIWVVKDFVRNGKRVEFSEQWRQLCGSVGFKTCCVHRAMLVKYKGQQKAFDGDHVELVTARKSFFRRLAENKGSPPIDWEIVLCMVKL